MTKMKYEWRKHEKEIYLPKKKAQKIIVPRFNFFTIHGEGNPSSNEFSDSVSVLYALSYGVKMNLKKNATPPEGYMDYTVYPLEGVWDINEEAKKKFTGIVDKDTFVYQLMIRQPNFVTKEYAAEIMTLTKKKKPHPFLDKVKFESIEEGPCIQMLHLGSYDDEPATFQEMENFAATEQLTRLSKVHREIYLSDARKVAPEKLKTVLRFKVRS